MKNKTSNRRLIFQLAGSRRAHCHRLRHDDHRPRPHRVSRHKKLEYNGKSYDTPYKVVVFVDGEQVAKL